MTKKIRTDDTSLRALEARLESTPEHPLVEPSLFYDPPYERPIEDEFAWHLVKYLKPIAGLRYQVRVDTPCAPLWLDFVVEQGARRVGFELSEGTRSSDGEDPFGEEVSLRDALVIGTGAVDVLYRFRTDDLMCRPHDALYLVSLWDADLFSVRGKINLHTLATREARGSRPRSHDALARVEYDVPEHTGEIDGEAFNWPHASDVPEDLVVRRLTRANPAPWIRDYDRAVAHYGISDDDLGETWSKSA